MDLLFYTFGRICATHPWEIIMAFITTVACILTLEHPQSFAVPKSSSHTDCTACFNEAKFNAIDTIIMTIVRCLAVLYNYHQFRKIYKMGSNYMLGVSGLFPVLSSFLLTLLLMNYLQVDVSGLKDTLFFFLLLIDLSKAGKLAQFAFCGSKHDVYDNIAKGIALLGPSVTLDTVVEMLVIGVGTQSGIHRFEVLCYLLCISIVVNYVMFFTLFPACLSLILELSKQDKQSDKQDKVKLELYSNSLHEGNRLNPIIFRIKLIMACGLSIVHLSSRYDFQLLDFFGERHGDVLQSRGVWPTFSYSYDIWSYMFLSSDHIVILLLLLALVAKFILFEDDISFLKQLRWKNQESHPKTSEKAIQTQKSDEYGEFADTRPRSFDEILHLYELESNASNLNDAEVLMLVHNKNIPIHQLETAVGDVHRGVKLRRFYLEMYTDVFGDSLKDLPFKDYDYKKVLGACCENVIGYTAVPVGVVGPLLLDGRNIYVPLATTETGLIRNVDRCCKALANCGITSQVIGDGMTRGPLVRFPSAVEASEALQWIKGEKNFSILKTSFDRTSRFARLQSVTTRLAGRCLYLRFVAKTGDAMGMNMLSKGTEASLSAMHKYLPKMEILSLSGNYCVDKKPAALNWIEGRGKSVVCETVIPGETVRTVLGTTTEALIDVHIPKNLIAPALAGSLGGFNSNASTLVSALFIATGQDPAQNVCSSNCMTLMEKWGEDDLYVTCTMPSIEVGTVGGGTILPAQSACLEMLGVRDVQNAGENAQNLARIVCAVVLVGELIVGDRGASNPDGNAQ